MTHVSAVTDEPPRGGPGDSRLLTLPGKDRILAGVKGLTLPPPIHHLTGLAPIDSDDGVCTFIMPASGWLSSSVGPLTGGALAFMADAPLGGAIIAGLGPGWLAITSDLSMSFLRPAHPTGETLTGVGRLIQAGRSLGLSEVRISDANGKLLAHGTSRCFLRHIDMGGPVEIPPVEPERHDTPDPWQRSVPVPLLSMEDAENMSGMQILQAQKVGDLPPPPLALLVGTELDTIEHGRVTMQAPASPWLMSPAGTVYGGATALLADFAMTAAVFTTMPAGVPFATLDLKVNYLRPVVPDRSQLVVEGRVTHRGKTLAVGEAEIRNAEGKPVVKATGTSVVLPDRSWRDPAIVIADDSAASADETAD